MKKETLEKLDDFVEKVQRLDDELWELDLSFDWGNDHYNKEFITRFEKCKNEFDKAYWGVRNVRSYARATTELFKKGRKKWRTRDV
jgi:hypothetical protein